MSRITADDRVRRMLVIIPWVASRPEGVPIDELCARFRVDRKLLVEDLATVSFVGVAPYTPDTQIDVVVEAGRVFVHLPQWFDRPLRLTAEQGLALVAAGQSLLSVHGADPSGPLARALEKLARTLGVTDDDPIDVRVGTGDAPTVDVLRRAIEADRPVRISYYAYGRDEHTVRVVEPHRLYAEQGQLYLRGHCRLAADDRVFRLDRISAATMLDETFVPPVDRPARAVFRPDDDSPRIVLDLEPSARWIAEQYPVDEVSERDDGRLRVTLAVSGRAWLERLLLRLGTDAVVVRADGDLQGVAPGAARRVLDRYRQHEVPDHGEG